MFVVSTLTLPTWQGGHVFFHSDEWHCDSVAFLQGRRRVMCAYAEFRDRWFGEVSVFEMQVNVQLVPLEQMTEFSLMISWSPCNTSVNQLDSWTATLHTKECFFSRHMIFFFFCTLLNDWTTEYAKSVFRRMSVSLCDAAMAGNTEEVFHNEHNLFIICSQDW